MTSLVTTLLVSRPSSPSATESQKKHVVFLPEGDDTGLDPISWDASLVEEHAFSAQVTSLPVENRTAITDHVIRQPRRLTLTLLQTNDPIVLGDGPYGAVQEPINRVGDRLAWLENAQNNAVLLTVITSLREYGNLVIERFRVTRDAPRGRVLSVVVELVELVVATSLLVEDDTLARRRAKDQGAKPAAPASAEQAVQTTIMHDVGFGVFSDVVPGLKAFDARVTP